MDEKERIEKIMQKEEMSAVVFAGEIGIQGSTLSHILNGRNNPSLDVLKKILNRFRTISSDWLILGIGSMYRSEKQSQTPTLFDSLDENTYKSNALVPEMDRKNDSFSTSIQQKKQSISEMQGKQPADQKQSTVLNLGPNSKSVRKIIVYYNDNTFQEFDTN